jgi:hypothetical protein
MFMVGNALFLLRGRAYLEAGEFQLALNDFDKLIADNPWNPDAHYYRAQTFTRFGDETKAAQDRTSVLNLVTSGAFVVPRVTSGEWPHVDNSISLRVTLNGVTR